METPDASAGSTRRRTDPINLVDHTVRSVDPEQLEEFDPRDAVVTTSDSDGQLKPPPLDVEGYLESVDRCRDLFPDLRVLSGLGGGRAPLAREYLLEVAVLVANSDAFAVLAHIDYPIRHWPSELGPFDPVDFEDEFRHALSATAQSGRALEINTVIPLHASILRWWREEGGDAVTFGSDAHDPSIVGRGLADAAAMAEAYGFRPSPTPFDLWARTA